MASAPTSLPACQLSAAVQAFAVAHYAESGAARFGIDVAGLAKLLAEVMNQRDPAAKEADIRGMLESTRLEELILARACIAGHNRAWEIFLVRYRGAMYDAAWKVAHDDTKARTVADSLYANLYGLRERGQARNSKLHSYLGRGSLNGWLRTVVAQEYVNQYRRTRRETSLEAAVAQGKQFAAAEPVATPRDLGIEAATSAELAALRAEERFLLAAYYLDRQSLAEIAKLLQVHPSTVSRKLDRAADSLRKGIRRRLLQSGMTPRQADETMQDVDVRDLQVKVSESLRQNCGPLPFYQEKNREKG